MSLDFYENRNTYFRVQLVQEIDGVSTPVAIYANANAQVLYRAFDRDETLLQDITLDKVDPAGDPEKEGIADTYILFDQEYPQALIMRVILQDTSISDGDTLSGKREEVFEEFQRKVIPSP